METSTIIVLRWLRRASQAFFLLLFFSLLFWARYSGNTLDLSAAEPTAPTAVNGFFHFDPFIAAAHLLSRRSLPAAFLLSLLTLAATAVLGRFFCGWICPFGTLLHITGLARPRRGAGRIEVVREVRDAPWQRLKYGILISLSVASLFTFIQPAVLDPLCILTRSCILSVFPAVHFLTKHILVRAADADLPLTDRGVEKLYSFLYSRELIGQHVFFQSGLITGAILVALLLMNLWRARFWCRFLCPLGALLGLVSRFSPVKLEVKRNEPCVTCGECTRRCQGGALSAGARLRWHPAECMLCLNCQAVCPEGLLGFSFLGAGDLSERGPDLTRRNLIASLGSGLIAVPLLRAFGRGVNRSALIRPPGSLPEESFLAACLRCGTCSRICPTSAIHSSIAEAGIEGLWTPRLVPRIGYCVYSCTLCGQVCPSQAIRRLRLEEKMGSDRLRPVKLGTAVVDRGRCIPWSTGMTCLACEEVCPVSPKAIQVDTGPAIPRQGIYSPVGRPVVDAFRCIGCGQCEYICPVEGAAAIRVLSMGETRAS